MVKTASPTGLSKDSHHSRSAATGRMKNSQQQAPTSSTAMASGTTSLPQCKVKRNYACAKCSYYTQNPRSFLHHQKNVHAERLRVYECSYCLYASKHSQKLQRHIQMVHLGNRKGTKGQGHINKARGNEDKDQGSAGTKQPVVPPVRIRVRFEKHAERPLAELVVAEDVEVAMARKEEAIAAAAEDVIYDGSGDEGCDDDDEDEGEDDHDDAEDRDDVEDCEDEDDNVDEEDDDDDVVASDRDDGSPRQPEDALSPPQPQRQQKKPPYSPEKSTFVRCSVCPFGSHSQTLVNRHEKTAHLKKKFFRCMKCNYVTHMRARYTKHVKYHTMPMIKCADCDFRTPYKWNLDRHNRNHSTTAPGTYKCSHCSFSADIKQSLTVHETNHHVPPVGGVFPAVATNRRRYRVGASDAPGSAVDGTEVCIFRTVYKYLLGSLLLKIVYSSVANSLLNESTVYS